MESVTATNFAAFSSFNETPISTLSSTAASLATSHANRHTQSIYDDHEHCDQTPKSNGCEKGLLGSLGSGLIDCVSACNDLLNTRLISSVGQIFNKCGPCGRLTHFGADLAGYATFKSVAGIGEALGGKGSPGLSL
ncbi:hypothetical protein AB4Y32_30410 [Paraburkholderia phymatum]|uniref:Uncharacterized protein n=1 Tax=Paraburkholderia phymatum TaxID=148447 RepID=A0ACC6U981_9BURK